MVVSVLLFIDIILLTTIMVITRDNDNEEEEKISTEQELKKETDKHLALAIAKLIINRCIDIGKPVSNLMLNRMLFLFYKNCKEWKINSLKSQLVFEAWDYGPVCRVVYDEYSPYGATKLTIREKEVEQDELTKDYFKIEALVVSITDMYVNYAPWKLTSLCREDQGYKDNYVEGEKNKINDKYYW